MKQKKNFKPPNIFKKTPNKKKGQQGKQKRADTLFNKFSFIKAAEVYRDLIENKYNVDYATRKLADCYAFLRDPRNASRYYKRVVTQKNAPIEYYYR